jgi:hypothetical protein
MAYKFAVARFALVRLTFLFKFAATIKYELLIFVSDKLPENCAREGEYSFKFSNYARDLILLFCHYYICNTYPLV